jgi:H+/Cl- antiporter ClcA
MSVSANSARLPLAQKIFYSGLVGIMAGLTATLFLYLLNIATHFRENHPSIIWALPLAGLLIGWGYHRHGQDVATGNNLILDEIHEPKNTVPVKMAPLILFSTLVTHLFGGSAGREGTAVQMSASLADQLPRFFPISNDDRKFFLIAGAGAGFGAAIGAPIAGIFFGMEMIRIGRLKIVALLECIVASAVADGVTEVLRAPHSFYAHYEGPALNLMALFYCVLASVLFAIATRLFIACTHGVETLQKRWVKNPIFRPFFAGIILVLLYEFLYLERYSGLGIEVIQDSFKVVHPWADPLFKLILTAITIGSGFKGGEFIPLVFIGATLGSAFSMIDPSFLVILSAVGFAAVFGAAANTPIACSLMAIEIFGIAIAPYAILTCFLTYFLSGKITIYASQLKDENPHDLLFSFFSRFK